MKKYILYSLLPLLLSGCSNFLDEQPSKTSSLEISTVEHLNALLGNVSVFESENNLSAVFSTDDFKLTPELYKSTGTFFSTLMVQFSLWNQDFLAIADQDYFWSGEYTKIFYANLVLSNLSNVSGSPEAKEILRNEAYLIRAYSNFQLVNTYAIPYTEASRTEPGITLKLSNSFEESVSRSTIEKTYEQIEKDLTEALKSTTPIVQNGVHRPWRGNAAAAQAFAARYYLIRGNYALAQDYASQALAAYNTLVDYNTEMDYYRHSYNVNVGETTWEIKLPQTWESRNAIQWKEFYFVRFLYQAYGWYIPSDDLLKLYDTESDLRYKYHFVESFSKYYNKTYGDYPGYVFFGQYDLPSGPTVAEMILTKAECQARQGEWEEAMNTLNTLRAKRIASTHEYRLEATSQADAIHKILEERRREMPFSARWFDIRRLNNNDYADDDVTIEKTFFPFNEISVLDGDAPLKYSISKNSRRWATPIPYDEIVSSNGVIIQNQY